MIEVEKIDQIVAERLLSLDYCYQCCRCSGVCPLSFSSEFRPRKFMLAAQFDRAKLLESDLLWQCTTCAACISVCPQEVKPPDVITSLRSRRVETGLIPQGAAEALENIYRRNNPWGLPKSERARWAEGLQLRRFERGMEWLWFVGCAPSYDPRNQKVAKALLEIFQHAGLEVGFLGEEERCCGDSARRLGEEGLFQLLAEENSAQFNEVGAEKILTTSPHCYTVFSKEYPINKEVRHYTQVLAELVREGKLSFREGEELTVTYHDPCYLGRHNGIYEEPRSVLAAIPGIRLVEMARNRAQSFCCGGGGGRMWIETGAKEKERLGEVRVKEALSTGAKVLVTACPFCLINLDEAIKSLDLEGSLGVLDLAELVRIRLA